MPPVPHIDVTQVDLSKPILDQEQIYQYLPHRFEMQQLTAVVLMDVSQHLIIGYRDVRDDEFWCRGHMPGYPIFPGVLMTEAAAQLACFYTRYNKLTPAMLMGLSGIENARFRNAVRPGDRLVLVGKGKRVDRRQTIFDVQGYVGDSMAFHAEVIGVPIPGQEQLTVGV
jgi:3-hydroxyacyl-[acyl-carrier-protein] dehydratase